MNRQTAGARQMGLDKQEDREYNPSMPAMMKHTLRPNE